jgi:hypothetical protein
VSTQKRAFLPEVQAVIDDLLPICRKLAEGRGKYAISVGGSQGKGTWDKRSDVDFRFFHEADLPWPHMDAALWQDYFAAEARWKDRGVIIDGIWPRKIGQIDAALDGWLSGEIKTDPMVWTVWGYHILPDIYHQAIIEDPYDVIGGWQRRLSVYPPALKRALLDKHLESVRYWRHDYHYQNKVRRGDVVFLAGLTTRLVHDLIQILFALNETYFVGDGQNLDFVRRFRIAPPDFAAKVQTVLYPSSGDDVFTRQYDALAALIDEVVALAE